MSIQSPTASAHPRLSWLADAARSGELHTVRVGWSDRLGVWRGKRVPVEDFLADPQRRLGFCDGMIVVDVHAGIIEATPFSNFSTGYPDMYMQPDLATLNRVGWTRGEAYVLGELQDHHGAVLDLMPRVMLDTIVDRLASSGIDVVAELAVNGRLMAADGGSVHLDAVGRTPGESSPGFLPGALARLCESGVAATSIRTASDGRFCVSLGPQSPRSAGEAAFLAKAALKELAQTQGFVATFMTMTPGMRQPSQLGMRLTLSGADGTRGSDEDVSARLADLRALLQPSVNAFKAGSPCATVDGEETRSLSVSGVSSEADSFTALSCVLAAACADVPAPTEERVFDLGAATERLSRSGWASEWLGERFVTNSVELLHHEAQQYAAAVTDWELHRYWRHG